MGKKKQKVDIQARGELEERISQEIKDVMAYAWVIKDALDELGTARAGVYTQPMKEVRQSLLKASEHLDFNLIKHQIALDQLGRVANEIGQAEKKV